MKKILFVCTGNTCRSPMAQGVFSSLVKEKGLEYEAFSAGLFTRTGLPISENSREALKDMGIDMDDFLSTSITDVDTESVCLFVTMTPEHKEVLAAVFGVPVEKICVLCEEKGGVADPYGGSLCRYCQCRDEIVEGIEALIERLVKDEN